METLGIIAEYNPFHNGHLYNLQKAKELSGAKYTIAIMGGNFLQRGEPALFDKWVRTKMALLSGIDLVVELPFVFASQDAKIFAHSGIRLLNALGIVDYISFGCEESRIDFLIKIAELIKQEPPFIQRMLKCGVKNGYNYPKSREKAILDYCQKFDTIIKEIPLIRIKEILQEPNNILALEYLISLNNTKSLIKPVPVKRIGSSYSKKSLEGKYSSATAIRERIFDNINNCNPNLLDGLESIIPDTSFQVISSLLSKGINPVNLSTFEQSIMYQLRKLKLVEIKKIHGIKEGLENRLKEAAILSTDIEGLIQRTKSKRFTRTRIQRILIHSLMSLTQKEVATFNKSGPLYCRILGLNKYGKIIINKLKLKSELPIIMRPKQFNLKNSSNSRDTIAKMMLEYDILATNLYVLGYNSKELKIGGQDYTNRIIILDH